MIFLIPLSYDQKYSPAFLNPDIYFCHLFLSIVDCLSIGGSF
jgi:hypothetical protein